MNIEAFDWNVIVVGFWNRAILTPAGIGRRLLGLDEGTPIRVEIPMDIMSVPRVKHDDLTVYVDQQKLVISADKPTYADLDRARTIAVKGIKELPETPLIATGFNFRIKISEPPNDLLDMTEFKIDNFLSDAAFEIKERQLARSVVWKEGVINLSIIQSENIVVQMNFDRKSPKQSELITWLMHPIKDVKDIVKKMFENVIKVPLGEIGE